VSIHVALNHVTRYRYDQRVALSPQVVRLRPAPHCRTPILSYSLGVEPAQHFVHWQQDPFSNHLARLVFPGKTDELRVTVDLVAEMAVYNPFDFFLEPSAEAYPFDYETGLHRDLLPYLAREPATPRLREFLASVDAHEVRTVDFLVALNRRLQSEIKYVIRLEPGVQTPEETLAMGSGSCRDSGWLLVQLLRHLGLAARFVSGYLIQLVPDVKALDGPPGTGVDFTDLHAWCEVYLPGAGWIGLDPTSGLLAGEGHLPLAATPEPSSAAPVSGLVETSEVELEHRMSVTRIFESPRVTRPYTEDQWSGILALGQRIDAELERGDVRLTMGGEPTFVAVDARDADEWNTAALGPTKRLLAADLARRLRERHAPGGFLHFGQGKWYPGETLPRWALSVYWRRDGEPCWSDPGLFADERQPRAAGAHEARRFIAALARALDLDPRFALPAYEDVWYYLWRERRLPVNVDPFDSRLDDEQERARLRRVFEQGLSDAVGYALPLRRDWRVGLEGPAWTTGPWFFRDERLYLIPGDSPMGYRLPLESLPWAAEGDRSLVQERDPFEPRAPLPSAPAIRAQHARQPRPGARALLGPPAGDGRLPQRAESAGWITRTALCVEPRSGVLHVFMPPLEDLEDYLELLAAVESTAADLSERVLIEGYPPPRDPRLRALSVTPDPGVIEVNVQPAADWSELVENTEFLYEAARLSRLSSEKFMLDGRHTGTGGGNHFVLGGPTAGDSPLLRRPDLLASLIRYWHNHPSLSYLFSGLFLGPTSQAPRVDEARGDQVYELEIALAEIERQGDLCGRAPPPWLVDRALRNILVDVTGNTHRAEFCIDKLYAPDSPSGRQGLLELRAFEMPPHARMSLVQQLLLRALIARFWRTPYTARPTRWGTQLHDRFLLPAFVELDFEDVIEELGRAGHRFERAWFAPHFEFRFPRFGHVAARGVDLQLRAALEPWHVLGEEGAIGGTARYVDSSLERVEVRVTGFDPDRYAVCANGRSLALQPTGRAGEYALGVRYRAWQPASALHPTIGIHAPLTFDLVDTWLERSLAGCRYHVAHPGGRNYQTFPVNAYEAESRRLARFFAMGHTPGKMTVQPPRPSLEFPFTLDLRRA
jgi:uncharacterized protein (DUF2126 family)/transglutaminase-like putative cysteine protease